MKNRRSPELMGFAPLQHSTKGLRSEQQYDSSLRPYALEQRTNILWGSDKNPLLYLQARLQREEDHQARIKTGVIQKTKYWSYYEHIVFDNSKYIRIWIEKYNQEY